jgi:hypothetical protein
MYKFLLKPIFFIFNLLFACWLVLKIEKISPSDFGKRKFLFESAPKPNVVNYKDSCIHTNNYIKGLCSGYKSGKISGSQLYIELEKFLNHSTLAKADTIKPGDKIFSLEKKDY